MNDIEKAKKLLESKGYAVKQAKPKTVAKTFQVTESVLTEFLAVCEAKGMKIRLAVDEALGDWCRKKR